MMCVCSYPEVPSSVPIWLDDLKCSSNDTNLRLCPHAGTGVNSCQHNDDVILSCVIRECIVYYTTITFNTHNCYVSYDHH